MPPVRRSLARCCAESTGTMTIFAWRLARLKADVRQGDGAIASLPTLIARADALARIAPEGERAEVDQIRRHLATQLRWWGATLREAIAHDAGQP